MVDLISLPPASPIATATITIFTRHAEECRYKDNPQWKRCNCRKSLYIREGGKTVYLSAKTRSWEQAENVAQVERDKRDPVQIELRRISAARAAEEAVKVRRTVRITDAVERWIASQKDQSSANASAYQTFKRRMIWWADTKGLRSIDEITPDLLDEWRGQWSPAAKDRYNHIGPTTQNLLVTRIKSFFGYVRAMRWVADDPSLLLKSIDAEHVQTMPLTPEQFEQVLAATYDYDAGRRQSTAKFGADLRAIFMLQRWVGLRIVDALMFPRSGLVGNRLKLTTQKTGAKVDRILPDCVVEALNAVPRRPNIHADQYFWTRKCDHRVLAIMWDQRVKRLNDHHLSIKDEDGNPMRFHSHMLRDTYAVELLKRGWSIYEVSHLLTHTSVKVTEKHYAPWVKDREQQLESKWIDYMRSIGQSVCN